MSSSTAPAEARAGTGRGELWRLSFAAGVVVALQIAAHFASAGGGPVAALAPLAAPGLIAILAAARRSTRLGLAALGVVLGLGAAALSAPRFAELLPLAVQLAICGALAWWFGSSLRLGRVALVTRMARAVHGTLPPPIERYTRKVTLAWAAFLVALCVVSLLLFTLASRGAWSVFANLLLLPLVALMFVAEYAYRTLRYRWFAPATLAESVSAFQRLRDVSPPTA
jgi:uncharacterized membrane protein